MKITDERHLLFLHVLDALILEYGRLADQARVNAVRFVKSEFEKLFTRELKEARNGKAIVSPAVLQRVLDEVAHAKEKHPEFAVSALHGASLVSEETGELAQAVNDIMSADGFLAANRCLNKARAEAAHVAVTALRFLEVFG